MASAFALEEWLGENFDPLLQAFVSFVTRVVHASSLWLYVFITVERYLAICHPIKLQLYSSTNKARLVIPAVVGAAITYAFASQFLWPVW